MARRTKVYEGSAKILYEGPEPGTLIQYFKDDGAPGRSGGSVTTITGATQTSMALMRFFNEELDAFRAAYSAAKPLNPEP